MYVVGTVKRNFPHATQPSINCGDTVPTRLTKRASVKSKHTPSSLQAATPTSTSRPAIAAPSADFDRNSLAASSTNGDTPHIGDPDVIYEAQEHLADSRAMEGTTNTPHQPTYLRTQDLNCTSSNLLLP
jgi:hypothetical protein